MNREQLFRALESSLLRAACSFFPSDGGVCLFSGFTCSFATPCPSIEASFSPSKTLVQIVGHEKSRFESAALAFL